ncbi:MAG TPA: FliH/SctL family protein [Polyangia bacterium]|nr:FliH/SctL family protein [Polyangia bacterium]
MGRLLKNPGRVVPAAITVARDEAASILSAARARAEALTREAEALRAEARRQGYEEGRAAAAAELTETMAAAALERRRAEARVEPALLPLAARLASRMAHKIVGRAVEMAPALLEEIAARALEASRARGGTIRLYLHPEDRAALDRDPVRARLLARLAAGAALDIRTDDRVGRHGCVVETAMVRIDARLAPQLAALERAVKAAGGGAALASSDDDDHRHEALRDGDGDHGGDGGGGGGGGDARD